MDCFALHKAVSFGQPDREDSGGVGQIGAEADEGSQEGRGGRRCSWRLHREEARGRLRMGMAHGSSEGMEVSSHQEVGLQDGQA